MRESVEDIIQGARAWTPRLIRTYPDDAHRVINKLADMLESQTANQSQHALIMGGDDK